MVLSSLAVYEHSSKLAVIYQTSILVEDIIGLVACKILIGHEAHNLIASPVAEIKICILGICAICQVARVNRPSGFLKLDGKLFRAHIILQVIEESGKCLRRPGIFKRTNALSPNPVRSKLDLIGS